MTTTSIRCARFAATIALAVLTACGGDDESPKKEGDAAVDGGRMRIDAGGDLPDGAVPGERGFPCSTDDECSGDLECVANTLPIDPTVLFGFCGQRCTMNTDCETGEACTSTTGSAQDLHCVELAHESYEECGPLVATICDGRVCLFPGGSPVGYCVDLCTIGDASDAGVEDAGAGEVLTCPSAGESCIEGVLSDPTTGLCGNYVERGEACAGSEGRFCADEDVCAWSDPDDPSSELRCFQSCGDSSTTCAEGSCVIVSGLAYCL